VVPTEGRPDAVCRGNKQVDRIRRPGILGAALGPLPAENACFVRAIVHELQGVRQRPVSLGSLGSQGRPRVGYSEFENQCARKCTGGSNPPLSDFLAWKDRKYLVLRGLCFPRISVCARNCARLCTGGSPACLRLRANGGGESAVSASTDAASSFGSTTDRDGKSVAPQVPVATRHWPWQQGSTPSSLRARRRRWPSGPPQRCPRASSVVER